MLVPVPWLWVALIGLAGLLATVRARRQRAIARCLAGLQPRFARLKARAAELERAGSLIRLFSASGPGFVELERRLQGLGDRVQALERDLRLPATAGFGARGFTPGTAWLRRCQQAERDLDDELAGLETALRGLADDDRECDRHRDEIARLHAALEHAVARHTGWAIDVHEAVAAIAREIVEADGLRQSGDGVRALERFRHLRERLHAQRATLEAREATLAWLDRVPGEVERLAHASQRLMAAGYRHLPELEAAALVDRALAARALLRAGALEAAAEAQVGLREQLRALHDGTLGREELQAANERQLRALQVELRRARERLVAIERHDARFPPRLWQRADRLGRELADRLARLESELAVVEAQNALAHQRFEEAHAGLGAIAATLRAVLQELGRCATMWQALPREECRLRDHFATLERRGEALASDARSLGLAPDPGLQALIEATRTALATLPLALDEVARDLEGAESALARFAHRVATLSERLSHPIGSAPRVVTLAGGLPDRAPPPRRP